jgi:hypothetical protein
MRVSVVVCLLLIVAIASIACGGAPKPASRPGAPDVIPAGWTVPQGVDAKLWGQLTAELKRALAITGLNHAASRAPEDKLSQITDLAITPAQSGGAVLTFSYRCFGDYDQNSEVNIADITPIAMYYLETYLSSSWPAAQVADGDVNGEVNQADITPIAQNYLVRIDGFELQYASSSTAADWTTISSVNQPDGVLPAGGGFLVYTLPLASPVEDMYYRVVPYEGATNREYGIPSTAVHYSSGMLAAPSNLQASDGVYQDRIYITWAKTVGATGYELFRDTTDSPLTALGDVDHYDDTAITDMAQHTYWVRATTGAEHSNLSGSDTGYLGQSQPGGLDAPAGVQASDGAFENRIYISWQKSANATGYKIFRDSQSAPLATAGNVAFYNDSSVSDTFQHTYWVKAIDATRESDFSTSDTGYKAAPATGTMVVLAWNDLGMHCMNQDFSELMILPPYNTLHAQVINRGGDPQIVTGGVTVRYTVPENTHSADKCNFWDYANALLGASPAPNIGLTGHGLAGTMSPLLASEGRNDWNVTGIPITPINDAGVEDPYNVAMVTVESGAVVTARTQAVVPVSWEISCDLCHFTPGGSPATDILQKHDALHGTDLVNSKPVLCGSCHAQPPLGLTGSPGVPSLSSAIHTAHSTRMASAGLTVECYACHPGIRTQCLRDVMYSAGETCHDCHGTMAQVGNPARQSWVDEPRCSQCHNVAGHEYEQPGVLYRNSIGHNGVHCAACHGSPHAITPTIVADDNLQAIALQGHSGTINTCTVCHTSTPGDPFNHTVGEGGED